jgi:hypothetical protein
MELLCFLSEKELFGFFSEKELRTDFWLFFGKSDLKN